MEITPNTKIGKYTVLNMLGQGASGCVVKAEQDVIHRIVALKVLFAELMKENPTVIKRFRREARLAAALIHPGIVPIFEVDEDNGTYFYTMQYIEGTMMKEYIAPASLTFQQRLDIFLKLCDAIALAHRHGIVHRDLKPHNVMITKDLHPVILDFGIAKSLQEQEQMTRVGNILGSAHYMAPEQAMTDTPIGTFTDVFALGVMIYEFMTGCRPFHGTEVRELIIRRIQYAQNPEAYPIPRMRSICPELPEELDNIVFRCLAGRTEERYQDASAVQQALQHLATSQGLLSSDTDNSIPSPSAQKQIPPVRVVHARRSYFDPFLLFLLILVAMTAIGIMTHQQTIPQLNPLQSIQKQGSEIMQDHLQLLKQTWNDLKQKFLK